MIVKQLRLEGKPIPTNDLWIAACALRGEEVLFTYDLHFDGIDGLKVIHDRDHFDSLVREWR